MGVFNYETETTSVIPAARLFKAFILDGDNLFPKVAPQAISSVENIEGNGGPGTIKKISFPEGFPFKYVKDRVDEVDHTNFKYNYSVIEGGPIGDTLEKISNEIKIVATPDGGSILKISNKYHTKGDHEVKAEQVKASKEMRETLLRAVESYLLAHSDAYN
uniref:Pollen allergen Bet v 1 n=1 Tax=Betula pendula TaxID=3505 RepID=Q96371_BETPN|nr:pollen allergen Bet v 1 [Betula pendula]